MSHPEPLIVTFDQEAYNIATSEEFGAVLLPTHNAPNVIVDLSVVTYLDSTCLYKLAEMRDAREKHRYPAARLVVASENVMRLFLIVGFDKVWPLFETLDAALADAKV